MYVGWGDLGIYLGTRYDVGMEEWVGFVVEYGVLGLDEFHRLVWR